MSRLIVVSNRVQFSSEVGAASTGGLAMAIGASLREHQGVWFGWSGETTERYTGHLQLDRIDGVTVAKVDLEPQDVEEYYNGYANKTLWPLFHDRIDLTAYERPFGEGYGRVNARFAEALLPLIQPDDIIWVHDYHLIPLGRELRRLGVKNRIGFFLHIPWPARQLLTTLPKHQELVASLFDYDLVGTHAAAWQAALAGYIINEAEGEVMPNGDAFAFGKHTRLGVFPIGIDVADFEAAASSDAAAESFERMRESLAGRQMIVGVDRLDYSKGLEERFLAYERYLADTPEAREKVFLLQIATLSRDAVEAYQDLRNRLDAVSGRVNGQFATFDWVPLRYVNSPYRRDELVGIYRAARVGLVTPLRDGMNLVAKEYVAAQDPEDPGVLILSRFAGAAAQMKDALIVNPFSREDVADAIRRGLAMPREERIKRWKSLMEGVRRDDVIAWRESFVEALSGVEPKGRMAPAA
ncbi:alpha,alpha-trehalose-phosphate synthase (UDP-forming) [Caulobacter sp. NIBR2454]|uniref:alpha,alpha-trehalose-phosphate synthase (UDP-forming) n=1 Tax=Caulobacter sp. NIBR2454 TaxID=3015996 RepID=UPI0022B5ECE1|nr:trehalose-6-phosphate synthase [Caulobacter sp. NIBR2454]